MQGDLFDPSMKLHRSADPDTSREGAEDAQPRLGEMQMMAYLAIESWPRRTVNELAALAGIRDNRTYGRRITELIRMGKVVISGTRKCSITNRTARTYRVEME